MAAEDHELAQAIAMSLQEGTSDEAATKTRARGDELQRNTPRFQGGSDSSESRSEPGYKRRRSDESGTSSQQPNIPASALEEQLELVHADAQHSADTALRQTMMLAPPGETRRVCLAACVRNHRQMSSLNVEHGSSLSLISKATTLLNLEFNDMDPEADWAKWEALGATIYFFAVPDEGNPEGPPACVLRTVLDGDFSSSSAHRRPRNHDAAAASCSRRVIVDYLMTSVAARGRGYAGRLLECARELAYSSAANLLVLAIEESCPFWMTNGFVLDDGPINERINCFPDTHLLKLPTNCPDDFPTPLESSSEDEDENEEPDDDDEKENDQLQEALLASMLPSGPTVACDASHTTLAAAAGYSPIDLTEEPAQSVEAMEQAESDDEEAQLQLAICLSLDRGNDARRTGL